MAVAALALPRVQLFDAVGDPLGGGRLYAFQSNTTTPLATYNSASGTVPNTHPVVADAGGFMDVWLTTGVAYTISVHNAADVPLATVNNIVLTAPLGDANQIPGISPTVAAGNFGMDPGEPGTEVLATNLAQEVQQLRFVLGELKGQSNWRQSRETLAQFQFNLDPGEAGSEALVLFGEQQVYQLRAMLREMKGGTAWYQSAETLTLFRLGTDPGEVNSEVLPLFGEQQLNQIRFVIREMKGTVQWYETNATRIAPLGHYTYAIAGWPDGVNTLYQWQIPAPLGMDFSRNSTVKMYLTNPVAGGVVNFSYTAVLIRDGQPLFGLGFTAAPFSPAVPNVSYLRFFEFGPNIFQGNDVIVFQLNRQGTDSITDTNTGTVAFVGGWFEYIGAASR